MSEGGEVFYLSSHFWELSAFIVTIAFAIYKGVLGTITKAIDGQIDKVKENIQHSVDLCNEANETLKTYTQKQQEVALEIEEMNKVAQDNLKNQRKFLEKRLEISKVSYRKEAESRILNLQLEATKKLRSSTIDIVEKATLQILNQNLYNNKNNQSKVFNNNIKHLRDLKITLNR